MSHLKNVTLTRYAPSLRVYFKLYTSGKFHNSSIFRFKLSHIIRGTIESKNLGGYKGDIAMAKSTICLVKGAFLIYGNLTSEKT